MVCSRRRWIPVFTAIFALALGIIADQPASPQTVHIYIVNVESGVARQIATLNTTADDSRVNWSPDGDLVAYLTTDYRVSHLYTYDVGSSAVTAETQFGGWFRDPEWSPDGTEIAYLESGSGTYTYRLNVMSASGSNRRFIASVSQYGYSWSPDSQEIAYTANPDRSGNRIYVANTQGIIRTRRQVSTGSGLDQQPAWSPDGEWIVFQSFRNDQMDLFRVSTTTGEIDQLTATSAWDTEPVWSPDGSQILFLSESEGNTDIYRMNGDGSEVLAVASQPFDETCARWSPDQLSILFVADGHILITSLADGSVREVDQPHNPRTCPDWSPAGQLIVFVAR